jgi:branched-chain amino acid transport system ATP-binding protein
VAASTRAQFMSEPLLKVAGVTKRFGGFTALERVDLAVAPGERLGLIGPNGSGKSTLVNCISGTLRNEEGSIHFAGRDIGRDAPHQRVRLGLARSFQIPKPFASMSVIDNLRIPLQYAARQHEKLDAARIADEAMHVLRQVGLSDKARAMSGGLTQVDMRKLELARAVAAKPVLLISDEAMAGLSASETDDILALLLGLKEQGVAVIMIEHVMRAVMKFSDRIAVLVAGRKIADAAPQDIVSNMEVVRAYLGE